MNKKKILYSLLALVVLTIVSVHFTDSRGDFDSEKAYKFQYAYLSHEELERYREIEDASRLGLKWESEIFGIKKLKPTDERFMLLRLKLNVLAEENKEMNIRFRNRLVEVYIDNELIQRNGVVGTDDIFNKLTSYYWVEIPLDERAYLGKEVILVIESPLAVDINNIDQAIITSKDDLFTMFPIGSLVILFSIVVTIIVTLLAMINMYLMRSTYRGKIYLAFIPLWILLTGAVFMIPYVPIQYDEVNNMSSAIVCILFIVSILIIEYLLKMAASTDKRAVFWRFTIWCTWIVFSGLVIYVLSGAINWSFLQVIIEKLILHTMPLICFIAYFESSKREYAFKEYIERFLKIGLITTIGSLLVYYLYSDYILNIYAVIIMIWVINLIYLSSSLINVFHTNLCDEVDKVKSEIEIFNRIEFSRNDILGSSSLWDNKGLNNFSVKYVDSILGGKAKCVSLILQPGENQDVEVVYSKNNFGNNIVTKQEAMFYYTAFKYVFAEKNKVFYRMGTKASLGFEEDGLYYYMIISTDEKIEDINAKALNNYALNIKYTTNNFVITRYVEKARKDVIKSFGKTIELRMESNNIIGVTDRFISFIAKAMGKEDEEIELLRTASYLKNIGTIIMAEEYVKDYHLMDNQSLTVAYKRSVFGYRILKNFKDPILQKAATASLYQFEKHNGSGYFRIEGKNIPEDSMIVSLAIAMTSVFRKGDIDLVYLFKNCIEHVKKEYKGWFDPKLIWQLENNRLLFETVLRENEDEFLTVVAEIEKSEEGRFII